jgi:hypothetical protein
MKPGVKPWFFIETGIKDPINVCKEKSSLFCTLHAWALIATTGCDVPNYIVLSRVG